jgi:hypothetical protein
MPLDTTSPKPHPAPAPAIRQLTIVAWHDPAIERQPHTFATNSDKTLLYWTPTLGPTATLLIHRLATYASASPETIFNLDELAQTLGVGDRKILNTIARLQSYDLIAVTTPTIGVRLVLPPLSHNQLRRMPHYLAQSYLTD